MKKRKWLIYLVIHQKMFPIYSKAWNRFHLKTVYINLYVNPTRVTQSLKKVSFPTRRAFKRQCTEDGSWLEGACEPVTCDPPPPIFHGSYHCTDGFRFDSVCRLNCSDPAGNTASAATGGSAHTVRLLHAPCKQVCPSLPSLSILALLICLSSFCLVYKKWTFSLLLPSSHPYSLSLKFNMALTYAII